MPWNKKVRFRANTFLQRHFMVRKSRKHPKHDFSIVHPIEKKLLITWTFIQWHNVICFLENVSPNESHLGLETDINFFWSTCGHKWKIHCSGEPNKLLSSVLPKAPTNCLDSESLSRPHICFWLSVNDVLFWRHGLIN